MKEGDKLIGRQEGEQTWQHIGEIVTVVHVTEGTVTLEYEDGGKALWLKPVGKADARGVYWEEI